MSLELAYRNAFGTNYGSIAHEHGFKLSVSFLPGKVPKCCNSNGEKEAEDLQRSKQGKKEQNHEIRITYSKLLLQCFHLALEHFNLLVLPL